MKVTTELRNLIRRRVDSLFHEECFREEAKALALQAATNKALVESEEYKNLRLALKAWEERVQRAVDENNTYIDRARGPCGWYFGDYIYAEVTPSPVRISYNKPLRDKYENMYDSIIFEITACKTFDDVKSILAAYGIVLGCMK